MAIASQRISDVSGKPIPEGTGGRVRVIYADGKRTDLRADLTEDEIKKLVRDFGLTEVVTRPNRAGERRNRRR